MQTAREAVNKSARRCSEQLAEDVRERVPHDLLEAVDFHGHLCPGLAMGYRAANIALDRLGVVRGSDEELLGVVENDACGVDAFQFLTGCTLGKGNLIYKDYGKHAFTLARRDTGKAVRVVMRPNALPDDPAHSALRGRMASGDATAEERGRYNALQIERAIELAHLPDEQCAMISYVEMAPQPKARIFESVTCSICGEGVMEPRSRMREGQPCCIPCATRYGRGWEINE